MAAPMLGAKSSIQATADSFASDQSVAGTSAARFIASSYAMVPAELSLPLYLHCRSTFHESRCQPQAEGRLPELRSAGARHRARVLPAQSRAPDVRFRRREEGRVPALRPPRNDLVG